MVKRILNGNIEVSINGGYPKNGWFVMETRTKQDDLGVPLFQETPILVVDPSIMFP